MTDHSSSSTKLQSDSSTFPFLSSTNPANETYICDICLKSFSKIYRLNEHKKFHNREWKCSYGNCQFACSASSHLQKHVHEKHQLDPSRAYQCLTSSCRKYGKIFPRKQNFERHCQIYGKFHGLDER